MRLSLGILAKNLKACKNLGDELLDLATFRVCKDDLLANEVQLCYTLKDSRLIERFVHRLHERYLVRQRDQERIDQARALESGLDRFFVCQAHRKGYALGGRAGIVQGFAEYCW